jgi:hypothetical protein
MTCPTNPFRYFNSSPEVIRLVVMMYVGVHNADAGAFQRHIDPGIVLHGRLSMMLGAGQKPDAVVDDTIILRDDHPASRGQAVRPARYPI